MAQNIENKLKEVGFGEKEAKIYGYLVENTGGYPSTIALKTQIKRSTVYKILLDLSVKGLVNGIVKGKKLYYQIEKPQKLLRFAKDTLENAEDKFEKTKKIIPELEGLFSLSPQKPKVTYFEGVEGIITVYEDMLNTTKPYEMLAFANAERLVSFLPPKLFDGYRKQKEKLGITTRGILPGSEGNIKFVPEEYANISDKYKPVVRFVPHSLFPYESEITIFCDNKVSIINMTDNNLIGLIIEDKTIHGMFKMIFELAWVGAEKV